MSTAVAEPEELEATEQVENVEQADEHTEAAVEQLAQEQSAPEQPPADAPDYVREHYEAILEKEIEVRALEGNYLDAKEAASEAKKDFEAADRALRSLIARGPDKQRKLPLGDPETPPATDGNVLKPKRIRLLKTVDDEAAKEGQEFDCQVDEDGDVSILNGAEGRDEPLYLEAEEFEVIEWHDKPAEPAAPVVDDAWRKAPFAELHLTEKQNELFAAVGVTTIGGLEDLRADIAMAKAVWPKGIGPAKITDIENRLIDWLDQNRDRFGEAVAAEAEQAA